jgi:hypothetical protein
MGRSRDLSISSDQQCGPRAFAVMGRLTRAGSATQTPASRLQTRQQCFKRWPTATRAVSAKREFFHRLRIGIANCCAGKKFRSTVGLGSFPFRYKTRGSGTPGEELRGIRCAAEVACPFAELSAGRHLCRERPGRSGGGGTIGSLSRQEGVPGDEALTAVWSATPRERRDMTAHTQ